MRPAFFIASLALHAAAFGGILYFGRQPREHHFQTVAVVKKPKKKPAEEKPPEEKPAPPPPPPKAAPPAPSQPAAPAAPKSATPFFPTGLTMGNGPSTGGVAVGASSQSAGDRGGPRPGERPNRPPPPKVTPVDPCDQPDSKPRPVGTVTVEYSEQARADGIEGRIQVVIHVGPDGAVTSVEVVSGIEPSLDAYVLSTLKSWKFHPATHCGQAVTGTLTWAQRFELGD